MTLQSDLESALEASTTLMAYLTGGVWTGIPELSRQSAPAAFDTNDELKPSALIKLGTEIKLAGTRRGVQTPFTVFLYQRSGYATIDPAADLVFDLLNEAKMGASTWNIRFDVGVYQQRDEALDCSLNMLRFVAARKR